MNDPRKQVFTFWLVLITLVVVVGGSYMAFPPAHSVGEEFLLLEEWKAVSQEELASFELGSKKVFVVKCDNENLLAEEKELPLGSDLKFFVEARCKEVKVLSLSGLTVTARASAEALVLLSANSKSGILILALCAWVIISGVVGAVIFSKKF